MFLFVFSYQIAWDEYKPLEGYSWRVLSNECYIPDLYGVVYEKTKEDRKGNVFLFNEEVEGM